MVRGSWRLCQALSSSSPYPTVSHLPVGRHGGNEGLAVVELQGLLTGIRLMALEANRGIVMASSPRPVPDANTIA